MNSRSNLIVSNSSPPHYPHPPEKDGSVDLILPAYLVHVFHVFFIFLPLHCHSLVNLCLFSFVAINGLWEILAMWWSTEDRSHQIHFVESHLGRVSGCPDFIRTVLIFWVLSYIGTYSPILIFHTCYPMIPVLGFSGQCYAHLGKQRCCLYPVRAFLWRLWFRRVRAWKSQQKVHQSTTNFQTR